MPRKYERFVRTEINFVLGKNGSRRPSSLDSRSIVVVSVSEQDEMLVVFKKFKFDNFDSKACLSFLNGFMMLIASYQCSILKENIVVRLFSGYILRKP